MSRDKNRSAPRLGALVDAELTKEEIAYEIGVTPRTIQNWIVQGKIPFWKPSSHRIRFNLAKVRAALAKYHVEAREP